LAYKKIVFDLLPKRYRKIKLYKYIISSIYSLASFWDKYFLPYRELSLEQIKINSQTIILEHYLNYIFGIDNIQIINTAYSASNLYIYKKDEIGDASNKNTYIYNKGETNPTSQIYIFKKSEVIADFNFTIKVPQTLLNTGVTQQQILSIVQKYVVLGVSYQIEVF
jgi:hypothetical protein